MSIGVCPVQRLSYHRQGSCLFYLVLAESGIYQQQYFACMKKEDVVQLKCGGPKMVILEKQEDYENVEANE